MVAAHHTFQYRSALREGLKAWGSTPAFIERLSRALPHEDLAVEEVDFLGLAAAAGDSDPMAEGGVDRYGETSGLSEILRAHPAPGRPTAPHRRPSRRHRCGPATTGGLLPLERAPKGVIITQYDLVAVARLGLVKIDLLGNRCLSELEEALLLAGHRKPLRLESIPPEDPPTLALIDRADTVGCFQLESPAMRSLLARLPIRRQSDIIAALALIRPGAAAGEVKSAFVRRARGEVPEQVSFPMLGDRLQETHGLFLYEEDIMVLLSRTGGISLEEADELRSAIVQRRRSAVLSALEAEFVAGTKTLGTGDRESALARRAWATAARFAAYSFNKAHAASYGLLAYFSAYTKAHHPLNSPARCSTTIRGSIRCVRRGRTWSAWASNSVVPMSTCRSTIRTAKRRGTRRPRRRPGGAGQNQGAFPPGSPRPPRRTRQQGPLRQSQGSSGESATERSRDSRAGPFRGLRRTRAAVRRRLPVCA